MSFRCFFISMAITAAAYTSAKSMDMAAQLDFHSGWRQIDETGEFHIAGIRMSLDEGWKTYWRVPGEGGLGPQIEIESSRNLRGIEMLFPGPKVFEQNDMRIVGYEDEVLFPIIFYPEDNNYPIEFDAYFYAGICEEVCIPISYRISASLIPHERMDEKIQSYLDKVPEEWNSSKREPVECAFEFTENGLFATARMHLPESPGPEYAVFEYADERIRFGTPYLRRPESSLLEATSEILMLARNDLQLDSSKIRITVLTPNEAIDINGCGSP